MSRIKPNEKCPCGSGEKFKKCCGPFLQAQKFDHPERLLRARYCALINSNVKLLWDTQHPMSARKLHDTWNKFERESQLHRNLDYRELIILDGDLSKKETATIVYFVRVFDTSTMLGTGPSTSLPSTSLGTGGAQDLSYLEEAEFKFFENGWYYFDGLRRSAGRIGCDPLSIKLGQLATLYPWESELN